MIHNGSVKVTSIPASVIDSLERLYMESPASMVAFYEWICEPTYSQAVTLQFHQGRLVLSELKRTAK